MKKIVPHLWYDKEAKQAAEYYVSVFPNSKIIHASTLHDTPSGDADVVNFELNGQEFMAISAGPYFKFNEAVSFLLSAKTKKKLIIIGKSSLPSQNQNNAAGAKISSAYPGRSPLLSWQK